MREEVEHPFHAFGVGVDESIVEDDHGGLSALDEHVGKGEAGEDSNLLLGTVGEAGEGFGLLEFADDAGDLELFVAVDGGTGKSVWR